MVSSRETNLGVFFLLLGRNSAEKGVFHNFSFDIPTQSLNQRLVLLVVHFEHLHRTSILEPPSSVQLLLSSNVSERASLRDHRFCTDRSDLPRLNIRTISIEHVQVFLFVLLGAWNINTASPGLTTQYCVKSWVNVEISVHVEILEIGQQQVLVFPWGSGPQILGDDCMLVSSYEIIQEERTCRIINISEKVNLLHNFVNIIRNLEFWG